jgi:hypothetical protein
MPNRGVQVTRQHVVPEQVEDHRPGQFRCRIVGEQLAQVRRVGGAGQDRLDPDRAGPQRAAIAG